MNVAVNLAVSEDADFAVALAQAREAGLRIDQAFDDLGIVSGQIDRTKLPSLARIAGVAVEEDRTVSIAR